MDKISPEEKIQWMKKIFQKKESISSVASKIGVRSEEHTSELQSQR